MPTFLSEKFSGFKGQALSGNAGFLSGSRPATPSDAVVVPSTQLDNLASELLHDLLQLPTYIRLRPDGTLLSLFALRGTICCAEINLEARTILRMAGDMARKIDIRPHILSSSQLAERLKISKKTLGRMIKDGRIPDPNRSPGNQWRFWTIQEALEIEELLKGGNVD